MAVGAAGMYRGQWDGEGQWQGAAHVFLATPIMSSSILTAHLQAPATPALLFAAKHGMTRVLERYASHVEDTLLPSMDMAEALGWLNLFCYTLPAEHEVIN